MSFSDFYTFFLIHYFEGKERYWSDFQFTASSMCFISRGTNNISMLKDQKSWRPVDQYSIPCTYTPKLIIVSKRDGVTEINFLKSEILSATGSGIRATDAKRRSLRRSKGRWPEDR